MATKIYLRRGLKADLDLIVLESGEPGWATDTKELYMGDGVTSGGIFVGGSGIGVDSLNGLVGVITVSGVGIVTISEDGQTIVISGEDILDVDSLNGLTGEVTISGVGGTVVTVDGQIITISGGGGGETTFLGLTDTPGSFSNQARKVVVVNEVEDALEFVKAINIAVALDDHDYSGLVTSGIANETLVFGNSAVLSGGKWTKTDSDIEYLTDGHVALVVSSGNEDDNITLLLLGYVRDNGWSWDVPGAIYIDDVAGELSQDVPTESGQFVRRVAQPHDSGLIWYNPDNTIIELQ